MEANLVQSMPLQDLLLTTKDGDWGKDEPQDGFIPFRVIRGADFPDARVGITSGVPRCYLNKETVHRRTLQSDDILIETAGGNRDRPTGRTLLVTQRLLAALDLPATCASFCRFLRVNRELADPRYVFWYLQHLYQLGEMWQHQVQHTGVARFQYTKFANSTLVPLPDRTLQGRIADILGSLDDKIELNRRTNETLEAMARTLFRSWFVDFDPVRAKADGQTPPGLDAATAKLFPDSFEPSALGPIPKGWRVKPIGEVVDVAGGSTPSTDEPSYWNGPHHFATPKDMAALSSPVLLTTERTITASGLERISSGLLAAGTVLLSSRAPIGYLAITEVPVAVNQGFIAMKCPDGMPNHYVLHWTRENMAEIVAHANGTTFLEISKTNFRPLKALVPDAKLLKAFADFVSPLHQRVVANLRETNTLAATRDALLPKLLSGEA